MFHTEIANNFLFAFYYYNTNLTSPTYVKQAVIFFDFFPNSHILADTLALEYDE